MTNNKLIKVGKCNALALVAQRHDYNSFAQYTHSVQMRLADSHKNLDFWFLIPHFSNLGVRVCVCVCVCVCACVASHACRSVLIFPDAST